MDILENATEQPLEIQQLRDEQLSQTIDFKKSRIDPAPFQLVERTSLYKVRASMGMPRAYRPRRGHAISTDHNASIFADWYRQSLELYCCL